MKEPKMWIGGKWVNAVSGKTYKAFNPATEEEIAQIPQGDERDVAKAAEAARNAFPIWSKKSQSERSNILIKIGDSILEHAKELAELDVLEHGTPISKAKMSIGYYSFICKNAAELAKTVMENGESCPPASNTLFYQEREPIGVCSLIIPWNFPITNALTKVSCAIATGNTCILKPPSVCSLTSIKLAEIFEKHDLPAGTVNVVTGPGSSVGLAMSSHPDVRKISFTGSSETGKAIMAAASRTVKRLCMELGGKNPFIVLEDADLEAAVATGVKSRDCSPSP